MFSKSVKAIFDATRRLMRNWRALGLMAAVYAGLLITIYLFVNTREATIAQLIITLLLSVAALILFFMLQAAGASYTADAGTNFLLKKSMRTFWKLFAISLPVIALTILALYLLSKAQTHLAIDSTAAQSQLTSQSDAVRPPIQWGLTALTALRYLLLGVVAPLLLIQFWITVSDKGLSWLVTWSSLAARLREVAVRAFAPESFLIYTAGFLVFAVIPYVTLFKTIRNKHAWVEVALLAFRLLVSATLILLGWLTTVGALSISSTKPAESHHAEEL
jgi:hypothetical protein